jgi:hypothetical protein
MARSQKVLEDQKQQIRLALRSAVWDADAYVVRGFGTPEERDVPLVLPAPGGDGPRRPGRRTEAEYAATVAAVVDQLPRHLLVHLPAAYGRLPVMDRLVLFLVVKRGHRLAAVAEALGWKRPSKVRDVAEQALEQLARWLWSDDGHATLPPEKGA